MEKVAGVSFDSEKTVRFAAAYRKDLISTLAKLVTADEDERAILKACEAGNMAIRENPSSAAELQRAAHRITATLHD